jgi:hypothetical protein
LAILSRSYFLYASMNKRQFVNYSLLLIYILCLTGLLYSVMSNYAYDDPYITYRYASQIAHGQGFVYNPGERVLSTTTPLFAMLLAAGSFVWPDIPHLANLIGCLSVAFGGLSLWFLSRVWKQRVVGWAGLWLYPTYALLLQTIGSETPLYLAFCLGAIAAYAYKRYRLTAALAALAVLSRADGILVAAVLAMHYLLIARRPIPWAAVGLFIGMLAPWLIFSLAYFGSPLPATLSAKQAQGSMVISQPFALGFVTIIGPYMKLWAYRIEALLAALGMAYLGWRGRPYSLIITWTILYFVAYSVLGVSRYFWYYAPLIPGLVVLVGLGIGAVTEICIRLYGMKSNAIIISETDLRYVILMALFLLPFILLQSWNARQMMNQVDTRVGVYREIGDWLRTNTPASAKVGTLEVGIIGYYAQRPMIDFAGLIQPAIAGQLTRDATYEDAALWAVSRYAPQYLVLHDGIFPRLERGYAAQHCQPVKQFIGEDYGFSQNMTIYACQ